LKLKRKIHQEIRGREVGNAIGIEEIKMQRHAKRSMSKLSMERKTMSS